MKLIDRPEYLGQLKQWENHADLVKIITGVRRCGKSKLFELFQNHLKSNGVGGEQIVIVNLEDDIQTKQIGLALNKKSKLLEDYGRLLEFVMAKLASGKKTYVFLDEIQMLDNWQRLANTLRLQKDVDIYLTGSNAYMFSSDLANEFGGRYIEIKMQPLSFKEYHSAISEDTRFKFYAREWLEKNAPETPIVFSTQPSLQEAYSEYARESGFPQTVAFNHDRKMIDTYLMDSVYRNTIQKDIIQRFGITDVRRLDEITKFLFDNIGHETSLLGICRKLKSSGVDISPTTLNVYVKGLLDSYLMYKCERYDIKGKRILESDAKYYVCDIGLRRALLGRQDADVGRALENVVFLELLHRGCKVSVGKVRTKTVNVGDKTEHQTVEVDFVATKANGHIEYYQVAWSVLGNEDTLRRELASLEEIDDNYPKYLLTMDQGSGQTKGIKRINVMDWLLGNDS